MMNQDPTNSTQTTVSRRQIIRAAAGFTIYLILTPALLFITAGTLNWPMAWVYVVLVLVPAIGSRLAVWWRNPDTLRERARYREVEGALPQDRFLVGVVALYGPMIVAIVAGFDHRFAWPPPLPPAVQYLALAATVIGYALGIWSMLVNRFFSAVARIQDDRGQVVVTTGPYRIVRHPAYAGGLLAALGVPLMLDAAWALLPALGMIVALVWRTRLEDCMLMENLDGYAEYAGQTKYRLLPGIW